MSEQAKNFIDKLLVVDPTKRMTADQALRDPWIALSVASSSAKNLHRSFSQNWLKSSSRLSSARSNASQNSTKSLRSGRSRRKNCSTLPQDTGAQTEEVKQNGSKLSGLRDSNVKLTKQLAEKLHSVINEDVRELLNGTTMENGSELAVVRLTAECESNNQQVARQYPGLDNHQTVNSNRKVQRPYEVITDDSLALQHEPAQEASDEKAKTIPVPVVRDGIQPSHLVMRDNFLEQQRVQETSQDWFQDSIRRTSYTGESPSRFHSPSRRNKVFCTYDSS